MTGIVILAAGQGARFGQPKQNLIFQNQTLLQRSIATAKGSMCRPIVVITGAHANLVDFASKDPEVKVVFNTKWEEGMASSIRMGIETLKDYTEADSALIMLCDQPLVTPSLIAEMLENQRTTGKAIVCCSYKNTIGVPVLFHSTLFNQLLLLNGHEGAKKILKTYPNDIAVVPFEGGGIDIDTPEDYERLIKDFKS